MLSFYKSTEISVVRFNNRETQLSSTKNIQTTNLGYSNGKKSSLFQTGINIEVNLPLNEPSVLIFFLIFIYLFIYLFLAVLGLRFCVRAFSSCGEWGPLFITVRGPLTVAASLVAEHRLQTRRLSSCGAQA